MWNLVNDGVEFFVMLTNHSVASAWFANDMSI
jgi:hypothetical protein